MSTQQQPAFCRSCGEPIVWLKHQRTRKLAPIEVKRDPEGNVLAQEDYGTYCIANASEREVYREWLRANHFQRCPNARGHAKTPKSAPAATVASTKPRR